MPLPDRYDINRYIPREVLEAHPAWLIAYDEEGVEGQDEATVKPNDVADPALPGFVTADVSFADGSSALALVGGDFGVAALEDLDDMRLYFSDIVWEFSLGPDSCVQHAPKQSFFQTYQHLLPMQITARLDTAFDESMREVSFVVDTAGDIRDGGAA